MKNNWCCLARCLTCIHFAQPDSLPCSWMSPLACGFRDFPVCSDPASLRAAYFFTRSGLGQQRRRIGIGEPRPYRRLQVLEHRSSLLRAGRDHRPDSFAPAVSPFTPRPLRDKSVDYYEADRLLCQVIGRLYSRSRNELEITRAVLLEPGRHVATVSCRWHVDLGTTQNLEPGQLQSALELFRREVFSAMNHLEELPQRLAQPFSVGSITSIRQGREELHIADQVGQAKLDRHVEPIHVAPIRRKVVTAQDSVELRAQHLDQNIRT